MRWRSGAINLPKKFFARPCGIEVAPGHSQVAQASKTSSRDFLQAPVASRWRPEAVNMPKKFFRTPLWHQGGARMQSTCPSLQNEPMKFFASPCGIEVAPGSSELALKFFPSPSVVEVEPGSNQLAQEFFCTSLLYRCGTGTQSSKTSPVNFR